MHQNMPTYSKASALPLSVRREIQPQKTLANGILAFVDWLQRARESLQQMTRCWHGKYRHTEFAWLPRIFMSHLSIIWGSTDVEWNTAQDRHSALKISKFIVIMLLAISSSISKAHEFLEVACRASRAQHGWVLSGHVGDQSTYGGGLGEGCKGSVLRPQNGLAHKLDPGAGLFWLVSHKGVPRNFD